MKPDPESRPKDDAPETLDLPEAVSPLPQSEADNPAPPVPNNPLGEPDPDPEDEPNDLTGDEVGAELGDDPEGTENPYGDGPVVQDSGEND